jgi:eukaryotic-like serine/threonine-protein kinase
MPDRYVTRWTQHIAGESCIGTLSPANILVNKQGVKVLDFGLAHMAEQPGDPELTQAGAIMGTPGYMAPEQLEGRPADARSDIYSFGCVLYQMLTGKRVSQDCPGLESLPVALASIVRTCLQKDPDDRWQSASDIKRALTLPVATKEPAKRNWFWIAAAMAILGVGILSFSIAYFRQQPAIGRTYQLALNPPEGERFVFGITEGGVALSPDGGTVTYAATHQGKNWLWIQPLDSLIPRLLPGTEGAAYPFWSPNGRSIGFFAGDKLLRIDLGGGAPSLICNTQQGRGGTWTGDDRILFGGSTGLFQVPSPGGNPIQFTKADSSRGEINHRWPQSLPDGHFLYWAAGDKPENSGVYAASLSAPEKRTRLLTTNGNAVYAAGSDGRKYLAWLRGETLVVQELNLKTLKLSGEPHALAEPVSGNALSGRISVTASATGTILFNSATNLANQLTWFNREGRPVGTLGEPGEYRALRLSPDGLRALVARDRNGGSDLWVLDSDRNIATRLTSNSGVATFPVGFPDLRTILFAGGNPRNIFKKDASGNEQRLTQSPRNQIPSDVSRDGRVALYYEVAPNTQRDLWTLSLMSGSNAPKLYLGTAFNESWGRFSPEPSPRWIAYQSDESGRYEVYVETFPQPSGKVQISTSGASYPQWGGRGTELFYMSGDGKLMAVDLQVAAGSIHASTPKELFRIGGGDDNFSPYEAAPDGQRFLVRVMPNRPPLSVIVNWPALLK